MEDDLRAQILKANEDVDDAIVQAETLMKANGITLAVTDTPSCSLPLCHTAEIISPLTNRYIQLIEKTDYLLRALDLLFQYEVIPIDEHNRRRSQFKKHVKHFYYACRRFDEGLRARMNAFEAAAAHRRAKPGKSSPERVALPVAADGAAPISRSATSPQEQEASALEPVGEATEAMTTV